MTAARTVPPRPELEHPHGWIGYVVADRDRTRNVVRLARWAILAAVLTLSIVAGALVILVLISPPAAAALLAGFTTAGGVALHRLRRSSRGSGTRRRLPRRRGNTTSSTGTGSVPGSGLTCSAPPGAGGTAGS